MRISQIDVARQLTRRSLLQQSAAGIGTAALASLFRGGDKGGVPGVPHHAPRAKRVIYLFQNGAPSHVDLFDRKPKLRAMHGEQIPESVVGDRRLSTMTGQQKARPCIGAIEPILPRGQSGAMVSELLPHRPALLRQVDAHDAGESRAGHCVLPDWQREAGPTGHGRLAVLRPRSRNR